MQLAKVVFFFGGEMYALLIIFNHKGYIVEVKGLYEIRIECESNIYRIFCCMDEGQIMNEYFREKKSYISRIENGKCDVQLSTLYKIFRGLGKQISVTVL